MVRAHDLSGLQVSGERNVPFRFAEAFRAGMLETVKSVTGYVPARCIAGTPSPQSSHQPSNFPIAEPIDFRNLGKRKLRLNAG